MATYSEAWQRVLADQQAKEAQEQKKSQEAYELKMEKRRKDTEEIRVKQAAEPPQQTEIALGSEELINRVGENFLTVRRSVATNNPMLFLVKKTGDRDRVAFPVVNGAISEAKDKADKLFYNRVHIIGSTRPADIKVTAE